MADQPITGLPTKTASGVASTDKMLGIDSAEGYQILVRDVAKYIIENCNVSTLAGAVQTPKAAIDALNSNSYLLVGGTSIPANANLDSYTTPGSYGTNSSANARTMSGLPTSADYAFAFNLKVENGALNDTNVRRQILQYFNTSDYWVRTLFSDGSWNGWRRISSETETFTPVVFSARVTMQEQRVIRCGNMVWVYIKATANQVLVGNTIITGLPSPSTAYPLCCSKTTATAQIRAIAADGIVMSGISDGELFSIWGCYIV